MVPSSIDSPIDGTLIDALIDAANDGYVVTALMLLTC